MGFGSDVAAPAGLPTVAHVARSVGGDERGRVRVEAVTAPFDAAALLEPGHLDGEVGPLRRVGDHFAVDAQPRDPAVGCQPQPHVSPPSPLCDGEQIVRIRFEHGGFHQRNPGDVGRGRIRGPVEHTCVHSACRRMVAREEAGVDVHGVHSAGHAQAHDHPVPGWARMPPGLPAVDDFSTQVEGARHEGRFAWVDEVFLEPEGLVAGGDDTAADHSRREIHLADDAAHDPSPNACESGQCLRGLAGPGA